MHTYHVFYRIGPAVDLPRREICVTAASMSMAAEIVHGKLYHRYPNYRLISIGPLAELPIPEALSDDLVEQLRNRA